MIYERRRSRGWIGDITIFIITIIIWNSLVIKVSADTKLNVLILYDRQNYYGYSSNIVACIQLVLGNFNTINVETENMNAYKKGDLNKYTKVFIFSVDTETVDNVLKQDLLNYSNTICWIGEGVDSILANYNGLSAGGYTTNVTDIYYTNNRKASLNIDLMDRYNLQTEYKIPYICVNSSESKIYGYMGDGLNVYPFAVKCKNLWYISRVDETETFIYIFSDLLNDVFNRSNFDKGKIFIMIEDVYPFSDTSKLKEIADYLYSNEIPYMISLTPTYVNPDTGYITTMSDKPDFVKTIQYMQQRGASIVLDGYVHTEENSTGTGEGYEFWDGVNNKPLNVDMKNYVKSKVQKGVEECLKNGIYPLAFQAPDYAMDWKGYAEIKKYFTTYVGRFQSSDSKYTTIAIPVQSQNTQFFQDFLPENLGYIDINDPASMEKIEDTFTKLSKVRGYSGGLLFYPYTNIKYLKEIVNFLQRQDVEFINLKNIDNTVAVGKYKIWTQGGKVYSKGFIQSEVAEQKYNNSLISDINTMLTIIISVSVIVFTIIFLLFKKWERNRYLR